MDKIAEYLKEHIATLEQKIAEDELFLVGLHKIGENDTHLQKIALMVMRNINYYQSRINVIKEDIKRRENWSKGIFSKRQQKKIDKQKLAS